MAITQTILWRRLDRPGHESARLHLAGSQWHLAGTALFAHESQPCRLDYLIKCNSRWETLSGHVAGWVGNEVIELEVEVNGDRQWLLNGRECAEVAGCIDLDLNFSPVTNLLPIRRLNLDVGQQSQVRAAWLGFPSFKFELLEQVYRRVDDSTYRYESAGGKFV